MRQGCSVIVVLLVYWLVPGHCLTFAVTKNVKFCYFADMHQLSAEQQETVPKNSTDCLRVMAARNSDVVDEELETMDRTALLELMARSMMVKKDTVPGAAGGSAVTDPKKTDRTREVELQLALKKMELEAEVEKEKVKAEAEKVKADAESENKRWEIELEAERMRERERVKMEAEVEKEKVKAEAERRGMELEDAKSQREHEWHLAQMNRADRYQDDNGLGDSGGMEEAGDMHGGNRRWVRTDTLADKVKKNGIALKQVVTPMPSDAFKIPQFF